MPLQHLWNQVRRWGLVIFQFNAAVLAVCLWGGSISDNNSAEMLYPGDALETSPIYVTNKCHLYLLSIISYHTPGTGLRASPLVSFHLYLLRWPDPH